MSDPSPSVVRVGITPLLILAYGAYYLSGTWGSRFETMGYGALCGTILVVLAVIVVLRGALAGDAGVAGMAWLRNRPQVLWEHHSAFILAASMLVYAFAQVSIGFLPATAIMVLWLLVFLRAGGPIRIAVLTVFLAALAWLLLLELLSVPLPAGPWAD